MAEKSKQPPESVLSNWEACNEFLRGCSEKEAEGLLKMEQEGKQRVQYLLRIHSRFNRERARRERSELLSKSAG